MKITIETKFNVDDIVYYRQDYEVKQGYICKIDLDNCTIDCTQPKMSVKYTVCGAGERVPRYFSETELYRTRGEVEYYVAQSVLAKIYGMTIDAGVISKVTRELNNFKK